MNNTNYRIAQSSDLEVLFSFAESNLKKDFPDDVQRMMLVWNSRFRKESLEHYLKLGWSFMAEKNNELCGFFIAQPLLFFQGQTQTLWVEYILAKDQKILSELSNIAYRLARDKHFQHVLFPVEIQNVQGLSFSAELGPSPFLKVKTSK